MTTKIKPSCFFEVRPELLTGEETAIDMLIGANILNYDIQRHISSFLDEEVEHPYLCGNQSEEYIYVYDDLHNKYSYPIDLDEKGYFDEVFDDDFTLEVYTPFYENE